MMKAIVGMFVMAGLAVAGPGKAAFVAGKVAVYPVLHPKKDVHAAMKVGKFGGKVVKTIVW